MSFTLVLPEGFSFVVASIVASMAVLQTQSFMVSKNRKAAKIPYPQLYAEKSEVENSPAAKKFNCAQRAHQNTLEIYSGFLVSSLVVGAKYPYVAAALGLGWCLGRLSYTYGYLQGPSKRNSYGGFIGTFSHISLFLTSVYTTYGFVSSEL